MKLLSSTTIAALLLALISCLLSPSSVEAKGDVVDADANTNPAIRRRAVESDKKDDKKEMSKKEDKAPKCVSVVDDPCHPSVEGMACCLDLSLGPYLECDDKNFLCKQMKDKDIEKLLAAKAAAANASGVAQAPEQKSDEKKNGKQKEPSCVETIGGGCDDISTRCCLNPSKGQFLQCKDNSCQRMKDKDIDKMLQGAASAAAGGGCRSDKDCCDEDKECNEVTGECFKPSCPKQCFHNDDVSIDSSNVLRHTDLSPVIYFYIILQ